MNFDVKSTQRKVRRIPFVIAGADGSPELTLGNQHLTVADTGEGVYTLTLVNPGVMTCLAFVTALDDAQLVSVGTRSKSSVVVNVTDLSGAADDGNVMGEIVAIDAEDQT